MEYSLLSDYKDTFVKQIALVPVKKMFIDKKYCIQNINIYPPNSLNIEEILSNKFDFYFNEYKEEFFGSTIIAIPTSYEVAFYKNPMPSQKKEMITKILDDCEGVVDILRFVHSNFEIVSNLPSRSGYLSGNLSGVIIYSLELCYFEFIKEKHLVSSDSIGSGLHITIDYANVPLNKYFKLYNSSCAEVGNILRYALKLYSNIVYAENNTTKFMLALSLLEYLADPYEYIKMQNVKSRIIPFVATNKDEYHEISERFKYLTSKEDSTGKQIGLRTCIVHNGASLESLIGGDLEVSMLLRELQLYMTKVIDSLLLIYDQPWSEVTSVIDKLRIEIESVKREHKIKNTSDVLIIIDTSFLNKAIQEVYAMYPNFAKNKISITKFLCMLVMQSDINRKGYKVPIQFFYNENNTSIYNSDVKYIGELAGKGFEFDLGEVDIYATKVKNQTYYLELSEIIKEYLMEMNCILNTSAQFKKIVLISDRNDVDNSILASSEGSYKEILLGRLDNERTSSYDKVKWFDIQYLIMDCLGIDKTMDVADNFQYIFGFNEVQK